MGPFFVRARPGVDTMKAPEQLTTLLEPVVVDMGYELVGIEYHPASGQALLRVYIDKPEGIDVDDCARVSHQVSGVLDVEEPISGEYMLEVSSPGLDRPLFKPNDYSRFAGERIRLRLRGMVNGRRKHHGTLLGLEDGEVLIEEEGEQVRVPLLEVDRAHVELEP